MAFVTSGFFGSLVASSGGRKCGRTAPRRDVTTMLVSEVSSRVELDKVLESAGESLVRIKGRERKNMNRCRDRKMEDWSLGRRDGTQW